MFRWGMRYLLFAAAAAFSWWRLHVRSEGRRQLEHMQRELSHNMAAFMEVRCPGHLMPCTDPHGVHNAACMCLHLVPAWASRNHIPQTWCHTHA